MSYLPPSLFFSGCRAYAWLVKVLGQFSNIYFRGLGLRIGLALGLGFGLGLDLELGLGLGLLCLLWSG